MTQRLGLIGRGTLLGMAWGVLAGSWYGTTWQHGALVGLLVWGPCVFTAVPGPYADVYEDVRID